MSCVLGVILPLSAGSCCWCYAAFLMAVQAMDDPLLLAALTPLASAVRPGAMRWSLCASDRCFQNAFMSAFFRAGQVHVSRCALSLKCACWRPEPVLDLTYCAANSRSSYHTACFSHPLLVASSLVLCEGQRVLSAGFAGGKRPGHAAARYVSGPIQPEMWTKKR